MEIRQLGDTWILSVDEMNRVVSLLEVESQRLNREKQATIDKLTKALEYIKVSHRCICSDDLKIIGLVCGYCMANKTLEELKTGE